MSDRKRTLVVSVAMYDREGARIYFTEQAHQVPDHGVSPDWVKWAADFARHVSHIARTSIERKRVGRATPRYDVDDPFPLGQK